MMLNDHHVDASLSKWTGACRLVAVPVRINPRRARGAAVGWTSDPIPMISTWRSRMRWPCTFATLIVLVAPTHSAHASCSDRPGTPKDLMVKPGPPGGIDL